MIELVSPTKIVIPKGDITDLQVDQLRTALTYTDQKVIFELMRLQRNARWHTEESFEKEKAELKQKSKVCLLNEGKDHYWTYSGLQAKVTQFTGQVPVKKFTYPEPQLLPWDSLPKFKMFPYQEKALEKLLEVKHGGVQMGTGLGKSFIIANLVKALGLKVVIMAPSSSIADQLYTDLTVLFGKKKVGKYFEGKKEPEKLIVVGTAQSFTRIEEGSEHWQVLQNTQVFIADESHQCPAKTLAAVCFGLLANTPYRFFFSATQVRNDGSGILLDAITGPIVFEMTVREGVDGGYLAKPIFHMIQAPSNGSFKSDDAVVMTRKHVFYNPAVTEHIGKLCNMAVKAGMPTLVLIEEVEQFTKLLPFLQVAPAFAHGTLNKTNRQDVPPEYWDSDPNDLVKKFNAGEIPLLIGTSCISTGTDVRAVQFLVYWQGGKSEIQVKQAIGRSTRKTETKNKCHIIDFWIRDPSGEVTTKGWTLGKHAQERLKIYEDLYGPVIEDSI